jgi:hypothetical protein
MNVLILGNENSPYLKSFIEGIKTESHDIYFSLISSHKPVDYHKQHCKTYYMNRNSLFFRIPLIRSLYVVIWFYMKITTIMRSGIIHLHGIEYIYGLVFLFINKRRYKLIGSFYGSDYYRIKGIKKSIQKLLYKKLSLITFINENTSSDFIKKNGWKRNNIKTQRWGLKTLDYIGELNTGAINEFKTSFKIDKSSIIVTCGSNSYISQNHLKIIDSIEKLNRNILDRTVFIFLLQYGDSANRILVEKRLAKSKVKSLIIDEYMDYIDIAKLRSISDILLLLQTTDQLSGTLLESYYAGNIIITGKWLPYGCLDKIGLRLIYIDTFDDLTSVLQNSISKISEFKKDISNTKKIVYNEFSIKINSKKWLGIYNEIQSVGFD